MITVLSEHCNPTNAAAQSRGPISSRPIPQAQTQQGNPLDYIKSQLLTGLPEETILNRWNFTRVAGGALTRSGHNENDYGWPRAKRRTRRTKDAPPHNNRVSSDQGSTAWLVCRKGRKKALALIPLKARGGEIGRGPPRLRQNPKLRVSLTTLWSPSR